MLPNQQNNHFKDRGEQIRVMIKLLNSSNNNIPDVDMSSYDNTLTKLLDNHNGVIDQNFINNVVLWKVNRYAEIDHETQTLLQTVKNSPTRSNPNIRLTLHKLLKTKGIKLAMATTILRFIKPSLFQLIDQRVYRVMYGYELKIPYNNDAKIDLYFKTKHATLPVWIELRPLVNGYPASNTIVPGSRKYLSPGNVSISDDASLPTTFTFDEPIYLSGRTEYAVVCICDNTDYLLWTSFMGDFELGSTSRRITKQPFLGSFFKSQNSTTWEASQEQDMKFTLYRADFATNIQAIAQLNTADLPDIFGPVIMMICCVALSRKISFAT